MKLSDQIWRKCFAHFLKYRICSIHLVPAVCQILLLFCTFVLILINWVLVPYYRWGDWGSKNSSNVSSVTKLVSKKAEIYNQNPCVVCIILALGLVIWICGIITHTHTHIWIVHNFWNFWPKIGQTAKWVCWLLNCDSRTLATSLLRWSSQCLIFSMGPCSMHSYQIPSSENY